MFIINNFTPIGGQTNRLAPTLFSYSHDKDNFKDLFEEGYFNPKRNLFHAGDTIMVRMADEIGQVYIDAIEGKNVVLDHRFIMAQGPKRSHKKKAA